MTKDEAIEAMKDGQKVTKQKTAMQEMIEWTIKNAFNIESQDGIHYIAIDHEEMRLNFDNWLAKEREQIIAAYERGDKYKFEISGEQMFNETYEQ